MEAIVAHELMHAWTYDNAKHEPEAMIGEGSCNYVAYLYLLTSSDSDAYYIIKKMEGNPDPVYGKGFLQMRNKFGSGSISGILSYIRNN